MWINVLMLLHLILYRLPPSSINAASSGDFDFQEASLKSGGESLIMGPTVFLGGLVISPPPLHVRCDRCRAHIKDSHHYHCLQCGDYDLCLECAEKGIYCYNDAHEWTRQKIEGRRRISVGAKLGPMDTRTLHDETATFPLLFEAPSPSDTPQDLFDNEHRYIRKTDSREILFYTDGACLRNGQSNPQAGCAFVHRPSAYSEDAIPTHYGTVGFKLEDKGPTGEMYKHTSNRAELRAVIGALQFRDWSTDCNASWRSIVVATDSEYVAIGATTWAKKWEVGGWMTYDRKMQRLTDVKNQDLWQLLLLETRKLRAKGVVVSFWRIPRELNERADKFARQIAQSDEEKPHYEVTIPTGPTSIATRPWKYY